MRAATVLILCLLAVPILAAQRFHIAVVSDGHNIQPYPIDDVMLEELNNITAGEFELSFELIEANWSRESIGRAFDQAYADPKIDMVLATGLAANQFGVGRADFPKPTFLPVVFDVELMNAPFVDRVGIQGGSSGKHNLSYLAGGTLFNDNLANFLRVAPVKNIALVGDEQLFAALDAIADQAVRHAHSSGVKVETVGHDGVNHRVADLIPAHIDGVMMAAFPRMPDDDYLRMIQQINQRGLPSFSFLGTERVAQGMLMTDAAATDYRRMARRNALNMQAVMLGGKAEDLPVLFETRSELTLNMETARIIGMYPSFDVLSEAVLLNEAPAESGPEYTLKLVAQLAEQRNLQLAAERFGVAAGRSDISTARANLLPSLSLGSSYTSRKESASVQAGLFPENSLDGSLRLSQSLYSDSVWANASIQQFLQHNREAGLEQTRLNTIQAATVAYLNVLRAETQLRVQQDNLNLTKTNLDLARDRVRVGSSSSADVYRWESRIASDRSALLQAKASLSQTRENLNRILNRPITELFQTSPVSRGEPFSLQSEEFDRLIDNRREYGLMTRFMVEEGLKRAPELAQIHAQKGAKLREISNRKRAFWLPDFSLSGQYSDNFDQSGLGVGGGENQSDWTLSVNATLPLFDGGARRSELSKSLIEKQQLGALESSIREQIEQQIRANMHSAEASFFNIQLSEQAAESARKNLKLVTDSYAKGVVSVIDLLDAQNASLQADEAAANAVYDFLIDVMNMQRSVGQFDFMLPDAQRDQTAEQIRSLLNRG